MKEIVYKFEEDYYNNELEKDLGSILDQLLYVSFEVEALTLSTKEAKEKAKIAGILQGAFTIHFDKIIDDVYQLVSRIEMEEEHG